ncbi:DJ-1/PfpI family protein [Kiritimatiellota bacterium B12222]|nr:DJ-1/PfpI family protein [Kiritimatiellota bacterium B12222]
MKRACVLLAPGCEEMEAVIVIDVLRRAGIEVVAAGLQAGMFEASRQVKLCGDVALNEVEDAEDFDLLVLPGGLPGTQALRADTRVRDLLMHYFNTPGKTVGVICAAALVLDAHGLLEGKRFTCYPSTAPEIEGGTWVDERVVIDGNLITSQGPGTAMAFALTLVERLVGTETRMDVAEGLLFKA